jgi:hypothetical protein
MKETQSEYIRRIFEIKTHGETNLQYIRKRFLWKMYDIRIYIKKMYYALFFGYHIVEYLVDEDIKFRWYKINKNCYGADNTKEAVEKVYSVSINTGTILNPRFEFFCDSSCKSDAIAKVKAFKKNKPLNTTCKNELMFTNKNTKDFHHFLLSESENNDDSISLHS